MNYSEMSDEQINHAVAVARGYKITEINGWVMHQVSGGDLCTDFCNSWADAGPIIQEYGIELSYDGISWSAGNNLHDIGWYSDWKNYPESPCRLAMIVFLMMKETE